MYIYIFKKAQDDDVRLSSNSLVYNSHNSLDSSRIVLIMRSLADSCYFLRLPLTNDSIFSTDFIRLRCQTTFYICF